LASTARLGTDLLQLLIQSLQLLEQPLALLGGELADVDLLARRIIARLTGGLLLLFTRLRLGTFGALLRI